MSEIFSSIKLKNKITIAASMAVFAAVLVAVIGIVTVCTVDGHKHKYNYQLVMNEDGGFDLFGVCTVRNCESPYYAESNVKGVTIFSMEKATCSSEGTVVYSYAKDGVAIKYTEKLDKVAHSYEYERVDGPDGISISGTCQSEGCTDPEIELNNIEKFELKTVVAATCSTPRKEIYEYTIGGQTLTLETQVDEYVPHTLNGVSADSLADANGKYTLDVSGITASGADKAACGSTVDGSYVCEKCKQSVSVAVILPGHSFVYSLDRVIAPTVEAEGKAVLCCAKSICDAVVEEILPAVKLGENTTEQSPATELYRQKVNYTYVSSEYGFTFEKVYEIGEVLSHAYEYELVPDSEQTGKLNLIGKCGQADCQKPEIFIPDVPAVVVKDTTSCQGPGELEWEYVYEGQTVRASLIMLLPAAHKYSYDKNSALHPTLYHNGSIELFCTTEGCNNTITIDLPKVVVDENAIFDYKTDVGGLVYKYTYATEHNCIVELNVTIYQEEE